MAFHYVAYDGPSLMRLMLAHYDREDQLHSLRLQGMIRDENRDKKGDWSWEVEVLGSDLVRKETNCPVSQLNIRKGAWRIRGLARASADDGSTLRIEGWYDAYRRTGAFWEAKEGE
jgi:hypothetical protein